MNKKIIFQIPNKPGEEDFWLDFDQELSLYKRVYYFFYRLPTSFLNFYRYKIKFPIIRLFNNGIAPCDLWSVDNVLSEYIYPRLKAFRDKKPEGTPFMFCEEYSGEDKVEGGYEAWLKTIDEMIYAFEYNLFGKDPLSDPKYRSKEQNEFWLKYFGEGPWEEKEENKQYSYYYYMLKENPELSRWVSTGQKLSDEECLKRNYELRRIEEYYRNYNLEREAAKRAQNGFELFGKYFMNLWF